MTKSFPKQLLLSKGFSIQPNEQTKYMPSEPSQGPKLYQVLCRKGSMLEVVSDLLKWKWLKYYTD